MLLYLFTSQAERDMMLDQAKLLDSQVRPGRGRRGDTRPAVPEQALVEPVYHVFLPLLDSHGRTEEGRP